MEAQGAHALACLHRGNTGWARAFTRKRAFDGGTHRTEGRAGQSGFAGRGRAGARPRRSRPEGRVRRPPYPAAVRRREPGRILTVVLAAAGGLVTEAAFPGRSWWPAAIVGIALLVLAWRRDNAWWAALLGALWGVAFFLPHLFWLHASVGAVPWVALVLTESAFVAALGGAWVWCRRSALLTGRPGRQTLVFALLWVVVEQLRSVLPFGGFPWGRLAFSQTEAPTLALASLGGAPLLSGVVAAAGASIAYAARAGWGERGGARPASAGRGLGVAAGLVAVGLLVPLPGLPAPDGTGEPGAANGGGAAGGEELRLAAVQGNVARPGLDAFSRQLEVLRNHVEGTEAVAAGGAPLDVVLWPENAADVDPRVDDRARDLVEQAVSAVGVPVLVGTLRYDDRGRYNDSVLWTPQEGPVAVYTKQHPAPFGEYIPMRDVARLFSDKVDLVRTDMLPGTEVGTVPLSVARLGRTVTLADAICFEVAYDGLVRDAVLAGGEVIVVQTNNASFGRTQESVQQLAMTRLRAVEHGRAAVQVSTVGVSGVFAPDGAELGRTELFTADQLVATVPLRQDLTLADRLGDAPSWAAAAVVALVLASGLVRRRRAEESAERDLTGVVP